MKNNAVHCTNKYKHVTLLHAAATMLAVWSAGISFDITWGKCRLVNFFAGPCKKLVLRPNFVRMRWTQLFFQWFWIWLYGSVFHFADPHFMEIRIRISWKYGSVFPEPFWVEIPGAAAASKPLLRPSSALVGRPVPVVMVNSMCLGNYDPRAGGFPTYFC